MRRELLLALALAGTTCDRLGAQTDPSTEATPPAKAQSRCREARSLERDGDYPAARKAYEACIADGGGFVDSHLGYQRIVQVEDGANAARDAYEKLRQESTTPMVQWAAARLQPRAERLRRLEALRDDHPDFAPVYYELSQQFAAAEVGVQSLEDKTKEKLYLAEFLSRSEGDEAYRAYFTDYEVAASMLDDARRRAERIGDVDIAKAVRPIEIMATPSNAGWYLTFKVEEVATAIESRAKGAPEYEEGWQLQLPMGPDEVTVEVRYRDVRGKWHGPFELPFDPRAAMRSFVKQTLHTIGPRNWIAVQAPTGVPNVYFTTLWVYRCGIEKIEYGFDTKDPRRVNTPPPCDPKNPMAIEDPIGMFEPVPSGTRRVSFRVTFADGEVSDVHEIEVDP